MQRIFINFVFIFTAVSPHVELGLIETVFNHTTDACEKVDIPDAPARAWRDSKGLVHFLATHNIARVMIGPDLNSVVRNCTPVFNSSANGDNSLFQDREWLHSPRIFDDGQTMFALVHEEYHGWEHNNCTAKLTVPEHCWYNSITSVVSTDGGWTWKYTNPPPGHLVASLPYQYVKDMEHGGYFSPGTIVKSKDGFFYSTMFANSKPPMQQKYGLCVMRTKNLLNPKSWRGWNGSSFSVQFADPYAAGFDPATAFSHLCTPTSLPQIGFMHESLVWSTYFESWMLVGSTAVNKSAFGFWFSLSSDLIHWNDRVLIRTVPHVRGKDLPFEAYPSVLDPKSNDSNFQTVGQDAYIYFMHMLGGSWERHVLRQPIRFMK